MKRIATFLRSRRLAATLLVALTIYAWLTTLVPLRSVDRAAVASWDAAHPYFAVLVNAFGMHDAYTSPIFLGALVLLTLSTVACAWERTRAALRLWRSAGLVTESTLDRLRSAPTARIVLPDAMRDEVSLTGAANALSGIGLRVRRGPVLLEGTSLRVGLIGSPLFHWALVAVFVFAALGQLTRHEGEVSVLLGESTPDAAASYGPDATAGPWFAGRYSGFDIAVSRLDERHVVADIERGSTPFVQLASEGETLAADWVYPNNPLKSGALTLHRGEIIPALVGRLRFENAQAEQRVVLYYDFATDAPQQFDFTGPGIEETITVAVAPESAERVRVTSSAPGTTQAAIAVGESAPVAKGVTFRLDALTYAVNLRVVNDWSVPWLYASFVCAIVGTALTVFAPFRRVRVMVVPAEEESPVQTLHMHVTCPRSDPAFPGRVVNAIQAALGGNPTDNQSEGDRA